MTKKNANQDRVDELETEVQELKEKLENVEERMSDKKKQYEPRPLGSGVNKFSSY